MADAPEVAKAKERLRELVVPAVEHIAELMDSEHDGIRLSAAKEVLDRGGVPAKSDVHHHVEIGLDDEIEQLIAGVKRQGEGKKLAAEFESSDIEDAVVIDENGDPELPPGEAAGRLIGVPFDDVPAEVETLEYEAPAAWWQANPNSDESH